MVDGFDALLEPGAQDIPFGAGEDARQDVKGNEALLGVGFAVDRKGDADAPEQDLRFAPAVVQHVRPHIGEPAKQLAIGGPKASVAAFHFVERDYHSSPCTPSSPSSRARPDPNCKPRANPSGIQASTRSGLFAFAHVLGGGDEGAVVPIVGRAGSDHCARSFLARSTTGRGVA